MSGNTQFIDREAELSHIDAMLDRIKSRKKYLLAGVDYFGISGVGKSRLIEQVQARCREKDVLSLLFDFGAYENLSFEESISRFYLNLHHHIAPQKAVNGHTKESIPTSYLEVLKRKPFVLIYDSCQCCDAKFFDWLGTNFIRDLHEAGATKTAVFLAGRGPRVEKSYWPFEYRQAIRQRYISAFNLKNTLRHIEVISPKKYEESRKREVYKLSKGHPFSTEALLLCLQELDIDLDTLPKQRSLLARRLFDAVITQKLMPAPELWPSDNFLNACFPRRFDAKLLEIINPDFHRNEYEKMMQGCMESTVHVVHMSEGNPAYHLDPLLRRILHTAASILYPERALEINRKLIGIYTQSLEQEAAQGEPGVLTLREFLYHHIQVALLEKRDPLSAAKTVFTESLETWFLIQRDDDKFQLKLLGNFLRRDQGDYEFWEILGRKGVNEMLALLNKFLNSHQPANMCNLRIQHNPPAEYQVTWSSNQNEPMLTSHTLHTDMKFSIEAWRNDLETAGGLAWLTYLPEEACKFLNARKNHAIQLTTDTMDIPFELMHDGEEFFCLARSLGRQIQMRREQKRVKRLSEQENGEKLTALVVGDPTGDLPSTRAEAESVAKMLRESKVEVDLLVGPEQATLEAFVLNLFKNEYHLIHYAGHGFFDADSPPLSGLYFPRAGSTTRLTMRAEEFRRYLKCDSFFFLNACETASAASESTRISAQGRLIENVATGVLEAGASGCLGPMWPIDDQDASAFAHCFYRSLLGGATIGEAVRQARIALRKSITDLWAAWVLFGDPNQHPLGGGMNQDTFSIS